MNPWGLRAKSVALRFYWGSFEGRWRLEKKNLRLGWVTLNYNIFEINNSITIKLCKCAGM